jgi:hypothetical protein
MERVGVTLVWTFHAVVRYERATVLRIEGVTKQPRHEVIARMSEAIRTNGGDILDSRFFSNTALGEPQQDRVGQAVSPTLTFPQAQ